MVQPKVDFSEVKLDQTAEKFLSSKASSTGWTYRSCLKRFVVYYGRPIEEYIKEIETQMRENEGKPLAQRTRPGEDTARGFVKWLVESQGYANKSTIQAMAAIQNYLKYYGLSLSWSFIKMPPNHPEPRNDKHQWTLDEMRQLVDACEYVRDKAMVLTAFQSGLGVSDLVSLNYGDIRREFEAGITPIMVKLFRRKTGVEFKTFLGRDAVSTIREYLKSRGSLSNDSPLFTMLGSKRRVTRHAFERQLRTVAPKLSFILDTGEDNGESVFNPARPHSLRSAFRSRLTGKMSDILIEFMLGHNVGDEKRAYLNMPPEDLRELYANYEHLLAIEKTSKQELEEQGPKPLPQEAIEEINKLRSAIDGLALQNTELRSELDTTRAEFKDFKDTQQSILKQLAELQRIEDKEED